MHRFRPRISLLTTLLLTTIIAASIVIVRQRWELGRLRAEVQSLRTEVGVLDIGDESKIHVVQVKEPGGFRWKWRVWLPKGHDYWLDASQKVPQKGITSAANRTRLGVGGQEINVRIEVVPNEHGKRTVYMNWRHLRSPMFEVDDAKWVKGEVMIGEDVAGAKTQVSSSVDEPLVLLRLSEDQRATKESPPRGLRIWIWNARKP